jgi:hypothetical protein
MTLTQEDKRNKIRSELIYDITHPEEVIYPLSKQDNHDIIVTHPECPYSSGLGRVTEHRYIWWLHNKNDPIGYGEVIHHINGNHRDNRIENLKKIKANEHRKIHGETIHRVKHKLTTDLSKEIPK